MKKKITAFSSVLVYYTLLVILWGAWVRISHSGDGCGNHWPLCQGGLIPTAPNGKTWIEYLHRLMSGVYGIYVLALFLIGRKTFQSPSIRQHLKTALILTIIEALLGAALVKLELVATDSSALRVFFMGLHLVNSLLLTAGIYILFLNIKHEDQHFEFKKIFSSSLTYLFLSLSLLGTIAALANTLFPSESLLSGLKDDFSGESHFLVQFRILHPMAALGFLTYVFIKKDSEPISFIQKKFWILILSTFFLGFTNLLIHDIAMIKIAHLLFAYLLWLTIIDFIYLSSKSKSQR